MLCTLTTHTNIVPRCSLFTQYTYITQWALLAAETATVLQGPQVWAESLGGEAGINNDEVEYWCFFSRVRTGNLKQMRQVERASKTDRKKVLLAMCKYRAAIF